MFENMIKRQYVNKHIHEQTNQEQINNIMTVQ